MLPNGFFILGTHMSSYQFFLYFGVIVAFCITLQRAGAQGMPLLKVQLLLLAMGIAGFVGARTLNIALNIGVYREQPWRIYTLSPLGYSLYGGLILGGTIGILLCIATKIPLWKLLDCAVPGIGPGIALMKLGCFLNGCCFGIPSKLPWSVLFPANTPAGIYYFSKGSGLFNLSLPSVHPTQLYEAASALLAIFIAHLISKKNKWDGAMALTFICIFSICRMSIVYVRAWYSPGEFQKTIYSTLYFVFILLSLMIFIRKAKMHKRGSFINE